MRIKDAGGLRALGSATWCALTVASFASIASGETVLDVQIGPVAHPRYLRTPTPSQPSAQSFTVGQAGTLDRVELQVGRDADVTAPLVVDILPTTTGGKPVFDATPFATRSLPAAAVPIFSFNASQPYVPVDLSSAGLRLEPGQQLAVRLSTSQPYSDSAPSSYIWTCGEQDGNVYAGGDAWYVNSISGELEKGVPYDHFLSTYVAVPEPSAAAAALTAGPAALRRRERRFA